MSFSIHGLGTAVPPDVVTPDDGLRLARVLAGPDVRTSTWLGPVYANSGVARRHQVIGGQVVRDVLNGTRLSASPFLPSADNEGLGPTTAERLREYTEHAPRLACEAATHALAESRFAARSITHLVTVSCTGFAAPGIDAALIRSLNLRPTVERTHIGFMGCHGALNGLRVARALTTADPAVCVLLCAVELCSLHYYYGNTADKLIANAIFADGAAAIVGTGTRPRNDSDPSPSPCYDRYDVPFRMAASGSCWIPESEADMAWTVGDHGFEMTLSRRVPGIIARNLRPWLESWLGDNKMSLNAVRSWAVHPGGPKILAAVEEGLELPPAALDDSRAVYAEYGNMSSPTVLFILDRLRRARAPRPCVALGFGPGLVVEAALFL